MLAQDEAALYLQATTMPVWAPRGQTPVVRIHTQRDKINFYGTLDLSTGHETVTETAVLNAEHTAKHLQQVLAAYPEQPIFLLWDRAPWHYGDAIRNVLAANARLEVMYLPTATPDLNPQEHVWKATRQAVSHNHGLHQLPDLADRFKKHLVEHMFSSSFLDYYGYNVVCPMFK